MKVKAYKDNVYIKLDTKQSERRTSSGIYIPDSSSNSAFGDKVLSGTVVAAGPGGFGTDNEGRGRFFPVDVSVGERVIFNHEAGQEVVVGDDVDTNTMPEFEPGTELRILRESEIIAVVD